MQGDHGDDVGEKKKINRSRRTGEIVPHAAAVGQHDDDDDAVTGRRAAVQAAEFAPRQESGPER